MSETATLGHCHRSDQGRPSWNPRCISSLHLSGVPTQALRICDAGKRKFFRVRENSLNFTIKQTQLSKQRFTSVWRQRLYQVFNHRSHSSYDLEIVRAAASDLTEGEIHKIVPVRCSEDQAKVPGFIPQFVSAQVALANHSQHAMKLIHCEHSRGRIVDRRRERL